jgi:hypothetical protein
VFNVTHSVGRRFRSQQPRSSMFTHGGVHVEFCLYTSASGAYLSLLLTMLDKRVIDMSFYCTAQMASFLLYLSDVEEGGETMFPFEVGFFLKCPNFITYAVSGNTVSKCQVFQFL